MTGGIFIWLVFGVVLYLLFPKKGGMMGCCGGHNHNSSEHPKNPAKHTHEGQEEIIDLKKWDTIRCTTF